MTATTRRHAACDIQTMTLRDAEQAVEWAAAEGWNPGLYDAASFYQTDPSGFFVAKVGDQPVGSISAVRYDDSFGFMGFFIVTPEYRRGKIGQTLWDVAIEHLGDRNVGLDGVVAQQRRYERAGFRFAYGNIRYEGVGAGHHPIGLAPLSRVPFDAIADYDAGFFPAARRRFLRGWLAMPNTIGLAVMDGGELTGYGLLRRCRQGFKVGPLLANDAERAELLFRGLSAHIDGVPLYLDVPEINPAATALAEKHGLRKVFETVRMYNREIPDLPMDRVFGVTSLELG